MTDLHYMGAAQAITDLGLEKLAFIGQALSFLARPLTGIAGRIGSGVLRGAAEAGATPRTMGFLRHLGKGVAQDVGTFGLLGGGLGAAFAEPGQRGEGFLRGLAGGALGGAAWGMGSNLARRGLISGLGGKTWGRLHQTAQKGWFSSPQAFGAKMVTKGLPVAAGLGASMLMPTFEPTAQAPQVSQPWGNVAQQQVANYGQPQYAGYMPSGFGGY